MTPEDTNKDSQKTQVKKRKSEDWSWFRHDVDTADGQRFILLRLKGGYEAHGIYWAMMKPVYRYKNRYPLATANHRLALANQLYLSLEVLEKFLKDAEECELLKIEDGVLSFPRVEDEILERQERSQVAANAGRKGGLAKAKQVLSNRLAKRSTRQDKTRQDKTEKKREATPSTHPMFSEKALIGSPPLTNKDKIPELLQEFFKSRGKIECAHNVWLSEEDYQQRVDAWGTPTVEAAIKELSAWSVNLDISPKTGVPGWKSYRQKRDHAKTLDNLLKRRAAA